jgi:O-methyltransferase
MLSRVLNAVVRPAVRKCGIDIVRYQRANGGAPVRRSRVGVDVHNLPRDFDELSIRVFKFVDDYTMASPENIYSLVQCVKYLVSQEIEGAFVECGVWKGGAVMAMALVLREMGCADREIYLYDTFSGMARPSDVDVRWDGGTAKDEDARTRISEDTSNWCLAPLDEVEQNIRRTGYPMERIHFVKGKVEATIPGTMPDQIAFLRLDTDFYDSTRHELVHLYPRLSRNGILTVDDYGHWLGSRKAVDEYITTQRLPIALHRVDRTGVRVAVKVT